MVVYQSCLSSSGFTLASTLQIIVPAVLVIAGWWALYQNARRIEARKEKKALMDLIIATLDEVQKAAILYYDENNNIHQGHLSNEIKANLQLVSRYLFVLQGLGITFGDSDKLTRYHRTVTGGYFETTDFRRQAETPGWESQLAGDLADLKLAVHQSFYKWSGSFKEKRLRGVT